MSEFRELYRNAIDLNRFSNGLARRLIRAYNDAVLDAVDQLRGIDELASPVKAARLRAILAQLNDSLNSWAGASTATMTEELQGLVVLQSEFAAEQLQKALPAGSAAVVGTVEVSPAFAQAMVTTQPTMAGVVNLSDSFERIARNSVTFQLTLGQEISLPNGEVIRDAFSRMSARQAELFSMSVRNGLIEGQSTAAIVRRLKGRLTREQRGSIDTVIAAGGQATSIPNRQIKTIVRTSITQVSAAANQIIAAENSDVTRKYRYTAILDTRTTAICRALDGKVFTHGNGPMPPQHYGCRSIPVNIPRSLEREYRDIQDNYGEWFNEQDEQTQLDVLGPGRLSMWRGLVRRYGPTDAMRKFVGRDGTELTLEQLRNRGYGRTAQ